MNSRPLSYFTKNWKSNFLLALLSLLSISAAHAQLFVANWNNGTIGEYSTSGATVNASLVSSGSSNFWGLAASGSDLFVVNEQNPGTIGEYTTSGATMPR